MKILMNVQDVALTMAQSSQIEKRLQAVLDGKRRRHSAGRATMVSALLLTATTVPLLAAAQATSDSPLVSPTKADDALLQYRLKVVGQTTMLVTSTTGKVTLMAAPSTRNGNLVDVDATNGETVFSADRIRIDQNNFVLNGNVVIAVRDKSDRSKLLFQLKAEGATLKSRFMDAQMDVAAKRTRSDKNKFFFIGNVVVSMKDRTDKSKTLFQFKADTATLNLGVERPRQRVSPEVAANTPKPKIIYKSKIISREELAAGRAVYIHKSP